MKRRLAIFLMLAGLTPHVFADWESDADARINLYRTANLTVTVLDEIGNPMPDAEVVVEMQKHAFSFGTAVDAGVINSGTGGNTYRSKLLENFNAITLENAHKWTAWEADPVPANLATTWGVTNGLEVRGHTCIWQYDNRIPIDVRDAQDRAWTALGLGQTPNPADIAIITNRTINHTTDICDAYKTQIQDWDVINENRAHHSYTTVVHPTSHYNEAPLLADWINAADQVLPDGDLFVNDYNILVTNSPDTTAVSSYLQMITYLTGNAPLDGIGFQGHYPRSNRILTPEVLWARLESFASFGMKLRITEFDMAESSYWNDTQEADWLDKFYKTCFSHPAMKGITMWGFTDQYHVSNHAPLYDSSWNLKPSGQAYKDLVFGEWWTDNSTSPLAERSTDNNGSFSINGFKGDYKITVYSDTSTNAFFQTVEADMNITVSGTNITVNGTGTNEPPEVVLASWDMETSPNSARQIASFVNTDVTATDLTPNSTLNAPGSFVPANVVGGAGDDYIAYSRSAGFAQTNVLGVIADNTYFSLTITPDAGKSISLSSITFDAMAGTAGPSDRQFYLMSDKTGYLSTAVLASASTVTGSPLIPYNTSTFDQNFSADLSGISAFSNITDSVTFRIYIATPTTSQNIGFDDITVKGIVDDVTVVLGDVSVVVEGQSLIFSWEADAWASYGLQTNGDLIGGAWGTTHSNLTGVTGTMFVTNTIPDAPALFYRVVLEDPVSP